jgi:hypothetical protein
MSSKGRWHLHSQREHVFPRVEQGRAVLVHAARVQAALPRESPMSCCITLADDGQ